MFMINNLQRNNYNKTICTMFFKYTWLFILIASLYLVNRYDYSKYVNFNFIHEGLSAFGISLSSNADESPSSEKLSTREKMFTIDELKKYTNLEEGLYISILGQVFDVTKAAKHYGPGATYHAFTGKDASLAFITGEFTSKGLTDDISSLSVQQVKALNDWLKFYNDNYIYKGKLNGRYYNKDGSPTQESYNVQNILRLATEESFMEEQRKRMFPPCNVEWNPDTGTVVWCSKRSGGIDRDWIGVPRMLFESPGSQQYRCACVNRNTKEFKESKGSVREYIGCARNSPKCSVKLDN